PSSFLNVQSVALEVMCQTARAGPPFMAPVFPTGCLAAPGIHRSVMVRLRSRSEGWWAPTAASACSTGRPEQPPEPVEDPEQEWAREEGWAPGRLRTPAR